MAILAAAQHQRLDRKPTGRRKVGRVGDDLGHPADPGGLLEVGVRGHQDRDRAQSGQRRDGDQRTGAGIHQHPDPAALPHPDLDQTAHHIVDAPVDRLVGVHPTVEQQELTLRCRLGLLGDDPPQRDSGVVVDLAEADQTGQGARGFDGQCPHREVGGDDSLRRTLGQGGRQLRSLGDADHQPGVQRDAARLGLVGLNAFHQCDSGRARFPAGHPEHPVGHGGPGVGRGFGSDDQAEVAGPDHHLVDIGVGGGAFDTAYRGRLPDIVDLADEGQHRAGDVGQRHELALHGEATGHHPVVGDELLEKFGDRRAGPGDPAFPVQEAPLLFARQQRLPVVQLEQELDPGLGGLERVEHLEAGAGQPARDVDVVEDVVGQEVGQPHRQVRRQAAGQSGQGVDRRAEGHDAGDVLGTAVGHRLIAEHPALGIAGDVHALAGEVLDGVDGLAQRDDVVGQGAFHTALDLVGRAVVDHPGVQASGVQDADSAVFPGDVPHVGRHHHRVHHQDRRAGLRPAGPVVRREVAPELVHRGALDDLERRRNRTGVQTAEASDFVAVLGGRHQALQRFGQCRQT